MAHVNDAAFAALRQLGYTGALPDMRYAYQRDIGVRLSSLYLQATGLPHVSDAALEFWSNPEYYPQPLIDLLFANGELGTFSDIRTYAANYFSDAGTTPAGIGDPIYQINDQGGNGLNWVQGTLTARFILKQDSAGLYLAGDGGDDTMSTDGPLAAGTYKVVVPTREGIWIDEVVHAGGVFTFGPTSYTGGPAGILTALATGGECRLIGPPLTVDASAWTAAKQSALVQWFQNRGAGPELELGPELVTNGTFDADLSGWVAGEWYWDNGTASITNPTSSTAYINQVVGEITPGIDTIIFSVTGVSAVNQTEVRFGNSAPASSVKRFTVGDFRFASLWGGGSSNLLIRSTSVATGTTSIDNVSVRKLQPKGGA